MNYVFVLILCVLLSCSSFAQKTNDTIYISMEVEKIPEYGVVISYEGGGMYGMNFDENKRAIFAIENRDAAFFFVHNGFAETKLFYGESGDTLFLSYDGESMEKTLKIKGMDRAIEAYLDRMKIKPIRREVYGADWNEFEQEVKKQIELNTHLLDSCEKTLKKISRKFVHLERKRIHYTVGRAVLSYPTMHAKISGRKDYVPGEEYYQMLQRWMKEEEELLVLGEYRAMMLRGIDLLVKRENPQQDEYGKLLAYLNYIEKQFKNKALKQGLMTLLAVDYVTRNGMRNIDELDLLHKRFVTMPKYREQYQNIYDSWERILPGKQAIDFQAMDSEGKTYTLADFHGKNICFYLWWDVYPCMVEFEKLKELKSLFEQKNIALVNLFVGNRREEWLGAIQKEAVRCGLHLYMEDNKSFLKDYHYDSYGVLQFILIDSDGKIVETHLPRASSGKMVDFLNKL